MKLSNTATQVLLVNAGLAYAQELQTSGPGPYTNASLFQDVQPTAQKSVPFTLWYNSDDESLSGPQWTWRTSVEVAQVSDSDTPNAQQVSQVYAFEWPNGGNLQSAVAQSPGNLNQSAFCVTVVESLFPGGTTNAYDTDTEDNAADGSCNSALRARCVNAILDAVASAEPSGNGCRLTDMDLSTIRQCEWAFEDTYQASTYNLLGANIAEQAASDTFPITSGEGFAHITTQTIDGSNTTWVDQAEGRLQMIIIDSGSTITPLCTRINTDQSAGALGNAATSSSSNVWLAGAAALFAGAYML